MRQPNCAVCRMPSWGIAVLLLAVVTLATAQPLPPQGLPVAGTAIPRFVEALPTFVGARVTGTDLTVRMKEYQQKILPATFYAALPAGADPRFANGSFVWAYEITNNLSGTVRGPLYPGFTVEATYGVATTVTYRNELESAPGVPALLQQYLKVDQTLHWADPLNQMGQMPMTQYVGPVPAVAHLHGGYVPSAYDGGPESWWTPGAEGVGGVPPAAGYRGSGYVTNTYVYPNDQEATTLFFHDHALGATRLNLYAGLAAFYFIRDAVDTGLPTNPLALPAGDYEVELAIQDRMFDVNGQLYFPSLGINPMTHPFWLPEFFGDVIVVNGKSWPFFNVEPRRYRFRIVNGSNARFYDMNLMNRVTGTPGPAIYQIGTDGGLLDAPVLVPRLLLGPGERADVIVDFSAFAGQTLTVMNSAKAPYPKGAAPDPRTVGQIMQFKVVMPLAGTDLSYNPALGTPLRTPMVRLAGIVPTLKRQLTLNEVMGMAGPLEVLVNNTKWDANGMSVPGLGETELPREGTTEAWEIINLTADAHPIHLHLVQYQIVSRQAFNTTKYLKAYNAAFTGGVSPVDGLTYLPGVYIPGFGPPTAYNTANLGGFIGGNPDVTPFLQGPVKPPNPNESGWKDTFIMYPGEVTRVLVRFGPQNIAAGTPAYFKFNPELGPGYVWHCHIVDHEDNEMMRPYKVLADPGAPPRTIVSPTLPAPVMALKGNASNEPVVQRVVPVSFTLEQNYPNPFNPSTEIRFSVPDDGLVQLRVYNSLGQEVRTLIDGPTAAGSHAVKLHASDLASGMYFYRLQAGGTVAMKKMLLLK